MNTKINKKYLILLIVLAIIIGGYLYSWLDINFSGIEKIKSYLSDLRFTAQLDESEIEESQISSLSDQMSFDIKNGDKTNTTGKYQKTSYPLHKLDWRCSHDYACCPGDQKKLF